MKHIFLGLTKFLSFSPLQRFMVRVRMTTLLGGCHSTPVWIGGGILVDVGGGLVDWVWGRVGIGNSTPTQPHPHPNPSPAHNCHPYPIQSPPLPPLTQPSTPHLTPLQEGVGSLDWMVLLCWGWCLERGGMGDEVGVCRVGRGWMMGGGIDVVGF